MGVRHVFTLPDTEGLAPLALPPELIERFRSAYSEPNAPDGTDNASSNRSRGHEFVAVANATAEAIDAAGIGATTRILLKPSVLDGSEICLSVRDRSIDVTIIPASSEVAQIVASGADNLARSLERRIPSKKFLVSVLPFMPFKRRDQNETY